MHPSNLLQLSGKQHRGRCISDAHQERKTSASLASQAPAVPEYAITIYLFGSCKTSPIPVGVFSVAEFISLGSISRLFMYIVLRDFYFLYFLSLSFLLFLQLNVRNKSAAAECYMRTEICLEGDAGCINALITICMFLSGLVLYVFFSPLYRGIWNSVSVLFNQKSSSIF